MPSILLSPEELSSRWGVALHTLSQWRWNGRGPVYVKLGRNVRYRLKEVEAFEERNLTRHTADPRS